MNMILPIEIRVDDHSTSIVIEDVTVYEADRGRLDCYGRSDAPERVAADNAASEFAHRLAEVLAEEPQS